MKKIYYEDEAPLKTVLTEIFRENSLNHEEAHQVLLMYIFHKGGLAEAGLPKIQFDAAYEAFIDGINILYDLHEQNIAQSV